MRKAIISAALAILITVSGPCEAPEEVQTSWVPAGTYRITEYCRYCAGDTTSLGEPVGYGIFAGDPADIPYGTVIRIDEQEYTMADYCGYAVNVEPTIDIYREWTDGTCHCTRCEYREVFIKEEQNVSKL